MDTYHTMTGLEVYVQPKDLWEFFMSNRAKLREEMCCIAENTDTGYELRLDIAGDYPVLRVFYKGEAEYGQYIATSKEAPSAMQVLVLSRLCPVIESSDIPDDAIPDDDEYDEADMDILQAMIDMREEELGTAVQDFLYALFNGPIDPRCPDDISEVILDSVCKMLARRFKVSVFRPTWVPCGGDNETYEEYPYLNTDRASTIATEPSSYQDALAYAADRAEDASACEEEDPDDARNLLDDLPAT